jgi:hypothetical protein
MKPNEDLFDDFKVSETAVYVNEAVGRVLKRNSPR